VAPLLLPGPAPWPRSSSLMWPEPEGRRLLWPQR
jgi:hypothetical protein